MSVSGAESPDGGAGQEGRDDVFPGVSRAPMIRAAPGPDEVAAGAAGFAGQVLAAKLAQVVGGVTGGVAGLSGHGADLGGEVGDGEAAGGDGQREGGGEHGPGAGLVDIDAADAGAAELGGSGQGIEQAVGDEADIDAVQCRAELLHHLLQAGDDGRELVQGAAAAQVLGVVGDAFEPQDAFAFGIAPQGQVPEVDLELGQVIRRCLDRDLQPGHPAPGGARAGLGAGVPERSPRRT